MAPWAQERRLRAPGGQEGREKPDGRGPRWAQFFTFFVFLVDFVCSSWLYIILCVRVHVSSPCGRSGEVRVRHSITFWSRVAGWQRAEVGTVSDFFSFSCSILCVPVGCMSY